MSVLYYTYVSGPVGDFLVAGAESAIHFTGLPSGYQRRPPQPEWHNDRAPLRYALDPLHACFAGEPIEFDIPLVQPGTPYQCEVWRALQAVMHGRTASYADIAARVGRPAASRAVGAANRASCIPVLVPCHRIIGADGSLSVFGGGLDTSTRLLELEMVTGQFDLL